MADKSPDLFDPQAAPAQKRRVYTVSEVTQGIKLLFEDYFGQVWVEGEVSNLRPSSAGHLYFSLKDESAVLSAVIFNRAARDIKFKIEDGQKMVCFGNIDVYAPRGQYQLIIEKIEPKGVGSLQLALEQLKEKLEKEGLFAPAHKKPIPYLPARVGVVTSLTGAAIKDILKVLDRRFRDIHIILSPVRVQGDGAKEDIALAIEDFNVRNAGLSRDEQVEVLIVGRGGGSIEDLWPFNEEIVARAIYNSKIPVISAVGHERDWTIADLVCDLRAATPSQAAELVIPEKEKLRRELDGLISGLKKGLEDTALDFAQKEDDLIRRLSIAMGHNWQINHNRLDAVSNKLAIFNPATLIPEYKTRIADLARQIYVRMGHFLRLKDSRFTGIAENLASLNPLNILARGYSVTFKDPDGRVIKDAGQVNKDDMIRTKVYKGEIISRVTRVNCS
ncbi:MAG: exodeoxyribonuclease VII large subunit [Candidatus Omnitrophica bacterium]|nr:exodeoxyribonuclease VII large subunit [Candidatus Omnitrophota bacterium]